MSACYFNTGNFEHSVALIGSWHIRPDPNPDSSYKVVDYFDRISAVRDYFFDNDVYPAYPVGLYRLDPDADFVHLEVDDPGLPDAVIQARAMFKILAANITYVVNPEGYYGDDTEKELLLSCAAGRPVAFLEKPVTKTRTQEVMEQLATDGRIKTPEETVKLVKENGLGRLATTGIRDPEFQHTMAFMTDPEVYVRDYFDWNFYGPQKPENVVLRGLKSLFRRGGDSH